MRRLSGIEEQEYGQPQDHDLAVEQDEHAGMEERPFAGMHAARRLHHSGKRQERGSNLPGRGMKFRQVRESTDVQAPGKCRDGEDDAPQKRWTAGMEELRAQQHHLIIPAWIASLDYPSLEGRSSQRASA